MDARTSELRPGTRLGPYTLERPLGRGATAVVYVAFDTEGRRVALKVRRRGDSSVDRRFLREFESMRLLRVPGVVQVHEAGIDGDHLWFSMDLVDGQPFLEGVHALASPSERVARVLDLGRRLCETLAALHEAGFIHRDVKPSNVLVDDRGAVHVLDFGIGRYFDDSDTLSKSGEVMGTVPYMAPEQLAALPNDDRVDIFATGLMLHEAVAGKRPKPVTTVAWIPRICLDRLAPLATTTREAPLGLSRAIERMLHVDPMQRPSARESAWLLRQSAAHRSPPEWPEPTFTDPGDWWQPASEGCLGSPDHPGTWVLEGPSGSGRRRIAEQIHRNGLLQGTWTLHLQCRCDRLGGPLLQLLDALVAFLDDAALAPIVGAHAAALRQIWPHLPLPRGVHPTVSETSSEARAMPSTSVVVESLGDVVARLGELRQVLLVFHDVEQVDVFTARALPSLARVARARDRRVGLLLLHESRWATPRSSALVEQLAAEGAGRIAVPPLAADVGQRIAASICPARTPALEPGATPQYAVERGWEALATWREESFPAPSHVLWPLSVGVDEIPVAVYQALVGRRAEQRAPWIQRTDTGLELAGNTAKAIARSRLTGLQRSASALAGMWRHTLGQAARATDMATLWLLAGQEADAWVPTARAAIDADHRGQYADARRWLLLLETLARPGTRDPALDFDVALAKARVALRTDAHVLRTELLDAAEAMGTTPEQEQRVRIVRAEYGIRSGTARPALVLALRLGATSASPRVTVRALLVAVQCRLVLGEVMEADREIARAEALLRDHPDPILEVQAGNWKSEIAFLRHDLSACRQLCQAQIRQASQLGYIRGVAFAASRLGHVLRYLGRRREAEHQTRSAREAFAATGDVVLDAESGLALATLLVERGESFGARQVLDGTIRRLRGLRLDNLLSAATRIALQVATLRSDPTDAAIALAALDDVAGQDAELPAALVRWWRMRGDIGTALAVPGPPPDTWGYVAWQLEQARAALVGGRTHDALPSLRPALDRAAALGFEELVLYGRLLAGVLEEVTAEAWSDLLEQASASVWTEVYLGALEMDARRLHARGDHAAARGRWRSLRARSEELGYRPGVEEATGWLGEDDPEESEPTVEEALPRRRGA